MENNLQVNWDYRNIGQYQTDWNQTLITQINKISSQIRKDGNHQIIKIKVSPEVFQIIKTLEFYESKTKSIGGKYDVIVDDYLQMNKLLVLIDEDNDLIGVIMIDNLP